MLRLAGARLLDDRDRHAVWAALAADPVGNCMVGARVETAAGLAPARLGGELWGADSRLGRADRLDGLCFSGSNLIPVLGTGSALRSFADRALRTRRTCSSVVGPARQVLALWDELAYEWGPAREVRDDQPLLATARRSTVPPDLKVRTVRPDDFDRFLPAAVAMFTEEVGLDPMADDGGTAYRARVAELIANGRVYARFAGDQVLFKAEIGALSGTVGQIQGVWVHPQHRGRGIGAAGTAAVVNHLVCRLDRTASLYVNGYNAAALATYRKVGFAQVGRYATVLF